MADGSLGALGSSIGLTATPKDYSSLYRYNQQLKAQQAKAKQDKLDDILTNVTVKSGENLHRLEVEPMRIRTAEFIDRARQYVGDDNMQAFYEELGNYQADINMARSRSAGYKGLETAVRDAAAGNKYVPKNVRQAAGLMLNSATSSDFINALNDSGVQRNSFFDYDDQANIMTQSFDAYNIEKAAKDLISENSIIIGRGPEVFDPYTKTKVQPYIKGLPLDDASAAEVRKMIGPDGTVVEPTLTAKEIPGILLKNTAFAAQYIDTYDLENSTPDEIEQHFFDTVVKPNVKLKESVQVTKAPGSTTIINQPGAPVGDYTFEGGPATNLNFSYKLADNKTFPFTVDAPYSVSLSMDGGLTFRLNPSRNWINKSTGQQYTSTTTQPVDINMSNVLPYEIKNGVKIVIGNDRVKQLKSEGKKVNYAAFIEGKGQLIGAEKEITNIDLYTELTPAIRSNIANQAAAKGKAVKAALMKGFLRIDQEVAAANK
jgi:hypothetical protein